MYELLILILHLHSVGRQVVQYNNLVSVLALNKFVSFYEGWQILKTNNLLILLGLAQYE